MAKGPKPRPWLERFEALFIPEPNSGCWLWLGGTSGSGYGCFSVARTKMIGAHRAAWMIFRGAIPYARQILHRCDNKLCVNPDHLRIGTHAENMAEAWQRGRSKPVRRKLSAEDVRAIRSSPALGRDLAAQYGVAESMISMVRTGRAWATVN